MLSAGLVFAVTQAEGKMLLTDIHALSKPVCICNDFGKKDSGKPLPPLDLILHGLQPRLKSDGDIELE